MSVMLHKMGLICGGCSVRCGKMWFPVLLAVLVLPVSDGAAEDHNPISQPVVVRPIVGGHKARIRDFPHQVSLATFEEDDRGVRTTAHFCGGSIISIDWVLTAAHCVYDVDREDILVRVGTGVKDKGGHLHDVSQIISHPNYDLNSTNYDSDIALLKVSKQFVFSDKVKPVKLNKDRIVPHRLAVVSGWGNTKKGGRNSQILRKVVVPVVPQQVCNSLYRPEMITSNMFCAGVTGRDSCQGDSGGAVMYRDHQIGIVSWGEGCGQFFPGVYTNVKKFRHWIMQKSGV